MYNEDLINLARDITRYLRFSGGGLSYPPIPTWEKEVTFKDVKRSWDRVSDRILQGVSEFDKIGIYAHIPFCLTKCFYCNLISFADSDEEQHNLYLDSLEKEIKLLDFSKKTRIKTVYIGGGTPTILSVGNLERLFGMLRGYFDLGACEQIMTEISSRTGTYEKIKVLKDSGVNKVTIGVQTLDKPLLKKLQRLQDKEAVLKSYDNARRLGIKYVNIDLMVGLPGQSVKSFVNSLDEILRLKPDTIHINPFMPNVQTKFYQTNGRLRFSDLAKRIKMIQLAKQTIQRRLPSAFERDELEKENIQLYNSKVFNSSVLGLGYAALSHANQELHYAKITDYKSYLKRLKVNSYPLLIGCKLNKAIEMRAHIIANLESSGCVSRELFNRLFKEDLNTVFKNEVSFLKNKGKIKEENGYLRMGSNNRMEWFIFSKVFYDRVSLNKITRVMRKDRNICKNVDFDPLYFYFP
jgi:oxygen-independent coproporphyrinogen-3 oxidase